MSASEPRVGDVWRERETRFTRFVRIEGMGWSTPRGIAGPVMVVIRKCDSEGNSLSGKTSKAKHSRFNGKSGGYVFHTEKRSSGNSEAL